MTTFGEAMNGQLCSDLVITADTVPDAITGDFSSFDPNDDLFQSKWPMFKEEGKVEDDWVVSDSPPEGSEDLKGMDLGAAMCRQDFDTNGLGDIKVSRRNFCCQMVMNDSTEEVVIAQLVSYGFFGKMSKNQETFQIDGDDYSMGALLFAGAQTVAGSIATAMIFQ